MATITTLSFTSGHVLGRVSSLNFTLTHLRALFAVLHAGIVHAEFGDVDDEGDSTLRFILRVGTRVCEDIEKEIALLQDMARAQEQLELAARKEGK
jgi:hypothetical protein